jgi:hypothetical protein
MTLRQTTRNRATGLTVTLAAVICTCALAACGSSTPRATTVAANRPSLLTMAQCMRAHSVPNFPDPTTGSGGQGFSVNTSPGSSSITINGITFTGPAFRAAEQACRFLGGGNGPPPISEAQKQGFIAKARCIRDHGVPSFPDPTVGPNGHGVGIRLGPGLNPDTPAIKAAAKACLRVGTPIPGSPT